MQKNKRQHSRVNAMIACSIALCSILTMSVAWAESMTSEAIEQRIKPVGQVEVEQQEGAKATTDNQAATEKKAVAQALTGEEVFQRYCSVCHAAGVAGAPKAGDEADWHDRAKKGVDSLLASVIKGLNVMPPRGTCADCSEAELKAGIEYMLKKK